MRNSRIHGSFQIIVVIVGALVACGCAGDSTIRRNLNDGFASLSSGQCEQAIAKADAQLTQNPRGPGNAEALYLKGRALETREKATPADAAADLAAARRAYVDALQANPAPELEAHLRAGVANIAYWQDDYATAQQQWATAYGKFRNADADPFILYRIGLCQQRLGQFESADRTFAAVQQRYPSTEAADRAKSHSGFRAFSVQLATFASPQLADKAMYELRSEGTAPLRAIDVQGRHVVSVGSLSSYASAQQFKARFAGKYPDSIIMP
jgi:tetratricopeptide (TPR) repeat protein